VAKLINKAEQSLPEATKRKVGDFWKLLDDIREEISSKKPSEAVRFVIQ
jgi:hypothetical protein